MTEQQQVIQSLGISALTPRTRLASLAKVRATEIGSRTSNPDNTPSSPLGFGPLSPLGTMSPPPISPHSTKSPPQSLMGMRSSRRVFNLSSTEPLSLRQMSSVDAPNDARDSFASYTGTDVSQLELSFVASVYCDFNSSPFFITSTGIFLFRSASS